MVAQLSCLQMTVVGRNTFIGAGNIFTDFHLLNRPIRTHHQWKGMDKPELVDVGLPVLGSAVGHNVKIGSGFVIYPARLIDSNTVLLYSAPDAAIGHNVVHIAGDDGDDVDEYGEPRRTIYKWPHRYDPDAGHGDDEPHGPMFMSMPLAQSVSARR
jgi:hypothetical protein